MSLIKIIDKLNLTPEQQEVLKKEHAIIGIQDNIRQAFKTGGRDLSGEAIKISDAMATPDSHVLFTRVINEIVMNAQEPNLIGHLLVNVMYDTGSTNSQTTIRHIGPLADFDFVIPEGGEAREITFGKGEAELLTATHVKYGLKVKITEEMLEQSQWGVINMWLQKAGHALYRNRDKNIMNMIFNHGQVIFDNADPNNPNVKLGRTLGRDRTGAGNGSMTVDDMIDMYSAVLENGYHPNVVLVHPLAWAMFAKDPMIRESGVMRGDLSQWYNMQVSPINPYKALGQYQLARPYDRYELTEDELALTQRTPTPYIPKYGPLTGLTVLQSHLVPYDAEKRTASVIMLDTNNTGALIIREESRIQGWDEPARGVKVIQITERWATVCYDEGRAIAIAKNISLDANELEVNPKVTLTNLAPINRKD